VVFVKEGSPVVVPDSHEVNPSKNDKDNNPEEEIVVVGRNGMVVVPNNFLSMAEAFESVMDMRLDILRTHPDVNPNIQDSTSRLSRSWAHS